ncbi:unnamed protein product [Closterium sp. NIES-53]
MAPSPLAMAPRDLPPLTAAPVPFTRAAPPPPPSPPSPPSMGTAGRGCEGVADVPQQQQLPLRLLLSLSVPHLVLGEGGELGGSGGGRRGSAAPAPPPFSYLPLLRVQKRGGGDLQHQPPHPSPTSPCCGCRRGGEGICSTSPPLHPPPPSPPSPAAGAAVGGGYGGGGCVNRPLLLI